MRPIVLAFALLAAHAVSAQQTGSVADWTTTVLNDYAMTPNVTYLVANNYEDKLDIYQRRGVKTPQPTLIFIHGGGWVNGTKESQIFQLLPYFEMGWNVVNVEYRLARVSPAPAAVEDCLCALRWVAANASKYNIDPKRLVVSGGSAGGHLALTTGMIPETAGLDRQCPGVPLPKVAAIVNWYGITDVNDLLDGPNRKSYAVTWLSSMTDREAVAKRVSPLVYVRTGLPPIITIHGDADPTVPYTHALRLRDALTKADVPNQLVTVPGGGHGNFDKEQRLRAFTEIRAFLKKHNLL